MSQAAGAPVQVTRLRGCAVLAIDHPPVNGIGNMVRRALHDGLVAALADAATAAVIVTGAGKGFSAGADIRQFNTPASREWPMTRDLHAVIAAARKPVVAALDGFALGGGLELALGCHYRVGTASVRLGLPEVKLGLIPGGGGTQRLPRLIGLAAALDMILSGDPVDGRRAHALGLLDALVEGDVLAGAVEFALARSTDGPGLPLASGLPLDFRGFDLAARRSAIPADAQNARAQQAAIDAVELAARFDFDQALVRERAIFDALVDSPESLALRRQFFEARVASAKPPPEQRTVPPPS